MLSPIPITPNMDSNAMAAALTSNFRQLESENRTKKITDEDGFDRVIFGRMPDGTYGIIISNKGIDVNTIFRGV